MSHPHILATCNTNRSFNTDDISFLEDWFTELVDLIGMQILIPPKMVYCDTEGNEGITGLVCIDTSHASLHAWMGENPYFKFDLYSCKDFDTEKVFNHMKALDVNTITYTILDRKCDNDLKTIDRGIRSYDQEGNLRVRIGNW